MSKQRKILVQTRLHVLYGSISLQNAFTEVHYIPLILRNYVPQCKLIKLSYLRETTLNLSPNGLSNIMVNLLTILQIFWPLFLYVQEWHNQILAKILKLFLQINFLLFIDVLIFQRALNTSTYSLSPNLSYLLLSSHDKSNLQQSRFSLVNLKNGWVEIRKNKYIP